MGVVLDPTALVEDVEPSTMVARLRRAVIRSLSKWELLCFRTQAGLGGFAEFGSKVRTCSDFLMSDDSVDVERSVLGLGKDGFVAIGTCFRMGGERNGEEID